MDIAKINSIKVNKNNLNNKDNLTINNNSNSNNNNNNSGNNNLNKSKCITEPDDQFLILNEKLNPNHTPHSAKEALFQLIIVVIINIEKMKIIALQKWRKKFV